MVDATSQLKRKREEAAAQRKSKKQRKSEAAGQDEVRNAVDVPIPSNSSTPKQKDTVVPTDDSKTTPQTSQTNGVIGHVSTPSKSQRKEPNAQQDGEVDNSDAQFASADASSEPSRSQRKKDKRDKKNSAVLNGEAKAEGDKAQSIPIPPTPQAQQSEKSTKKNEKRDRNSESKAETKVLVKAQSSDFSNLQVSNPTKTKKQKNKTAARWVASPSQGGWFLPTDPIFSPDEKYLILANLKSLQIYSTETSLLANMLSVGSTGVLTAYALSTTKPNQAYVADSNGLITLWDWVDGTKIGRWDIGASVQNMTVITQPESDEELVYCHEVGKNHIINIHALRTKSQASKTELKRVLKTSSSIHNIQVLLQGKYVVVASSDSIMVGKRSKLSKTALQEFEYVWRELKFSRRITTCNTYIREPEVAGKVKKLVQDQRDILDIAVGEDTGVILLFENILATFAAIESNQKGKKDRIDSAESVRPKRLHWHRDAVGAVKWSLDGNYLISGGDETVLTIWQLATGKPQHLPHLTAAIENVTVSPSGTSYALTLANNSVIVLSTTELEAKTNIVGIQSRRVDLEQLPRESVSNKTSFAIFRSVPMAINPKNPNEVLFSVPSSQPRQKNEGLRPQPYLQTFDLANHRAKSRQALTRNNATEPNVAPEGGRVIEPSVKLLQVSHDGEWLATVDEWVPPRGDTGYLNEGIPEFNEEERLHRREVYLKIWRRDEENAQWKLDARIDSPHFFEDVCGSGRVFDLVADPVAAGFATVGEDHVVRIWRPKTRLRDGIVVRGVDEQGLVTWSLDRSIEISDKLDVLEASASSQRSLTPRTARLAFSADGSVLAVAIAWVSDSDPGVTHLIDTQRATIRRSITEVDVTALSGLGFVGRHLVVVAESITVWDMVVDQLLYSLHINTAGIDRYKRIPLVRFAVNEIDGTFAVALPQFEKNESSGSDLMRASSRISIYDSEHQEALWSSTTPAITLALVSRNGERGYVALDSTSCIKTIGPTAGSLQLPTPPPEEKAELRRTTYTLEQDMDVEEESSGILAAISVPDDLTQSSEDDDLNVRLQSLQDVLDDGSVLPPPQGLFNAVLGLLTKDSRIAG